MRGKVLIHPSAFAIARITPAYAGKRAVFVLNFGDFWDHPRLCGEKELKNPYLNAIFRITPAYAGKRVSSTGTPFIM